MADDTTHHTVDHGNNTRTSFDVKDTGIKGMDGKNWVQVTKVHTTDQNVPKGSPDRHPPTPKTAKDTYGK